MNSLIDQALEALDCGKLSYDDWIRVGMALKNEGYAVSAWENWSRMDTARFHEGECEKKWETFKAGHGHPVSGGTIVNLAREQGWTPAQTSDETMSGKQDSPVKKEMESSSAAFVEQDDKAEEDDDFFSGLPEVIEGVKVDPQNPFATEAFLNTAYQMNSYRRKRQNREFPVRLEAWFERWVPAEDGSGVFARDPDAQLDMIELELSEELKTKIGESDIPITAWRMESSLREF